MNGDVFVFIQHVPENVRSSLRGYPEQSLTYLTRYDLSTILWLSGAALLLRRPLQSYSAVWICRDECQTTMKGLTRGHGYVEVFWHHPHGPYGHEPYEPGQNQGTHRPPAPA